MRKLTTSLILALAILSQSIIANNLELTAFYKSFREAQDSAQREALLSELSDSAIKSFLSAPSLTVGELRQVSDEALMALIKRLPSEPLHPTILASLKNDDFVLMALRSNPRLLQEKRSEVPAAEWDRINNLWQEHTRNILEGLGSLEGCAAVLRGLGLE